MIKKIQIADTIIEISKWYFSVVKYNFKYFWFTSKVPRKCIITTKIIIKLKTVYYVH